MAIGYKVTTQDKVTYQTVSTGWGGGYGYRWGGGWGVGTSTTYASEYTEGTLIIGIFDTGRKELVWNGSGTGTIDPSASPERRDENIQEAVSKILKDFPPGS
jgi:hypothetical protein